jgi:hypothetical protein
VTNSTGGNPGVSGPVLDVARLEAGVYWVRIGLPGGDILESKCRVEAKTLSSGARVENFTFESAALNKEIMLGHIQSRDITQAVMAVHRSAV